MSLNTTPSGERVHIGFFGRRNAGKSSVVNAITGQEVSIVSEQKGTTTDPVRKAMEILPIGPVLIIDTPGFDDEGALGSQRVKRARQTLNRTDVAVLIVDAAAGMSACDRELIALFREKEIPWILVRNKADLLDVVPEETPEEIYVSAKTGRNIPELREKIAQKGKDTENSRTLIGDLIGPGQLAVLVIPIDFAAPKGRLILPQQQVIRDLLDHGAQALCVRESELGALLQELKIPPAAVITDSQAFGAVSRIVPETIPLTSFSILMARYKGTLESQIEGIAALKKLKDGDTILISEGCTHHRQCGDIGTEKLPAWIRNYSGAQFRIETSSGGSFPEELGEYACILHCGGCMLNEREMQYRMRCAQDQNVPFTNYGVAIAFLHGILERSLELFPTLLERLRQEDG